MSTLANYGQAQQALLAQGVRDPKTGQMVYPQPGQGYITLSDGSKLMPSPAPELSSTGNLDTNNPLSVAQYLGQDPNSVDVGEPTWIPADTSKGPSLAKIVATTFLIGAAGGLAAGYGGPEIASLFGDSGSAAGGAAAADAAPTLSTPIVSGAQGLADLGTAGGTTLTSLGTAPAALGTGVGTGVAGSTAIPAGQVNAATGATGITSADTAGGVTPSSTLAPAGSTSPSLVNSTLAGTGSSLLKNPWLKFGITAGAAVGQDLLANSSINKALQQQQAATNEALGINSSIYNTNESYLAPYRNVGANASTTLGDLLGLPSTAPQTTYGPPVQGNGLQPGTLAPPKTPSTPTIGTAAYSQSPSSVSPMVASAMAPVATTTPGTVAVKSPQGQVYMVPSSRLPEALAQGGQQL